jgi:hypothetical protein
MLLNKGGEVLLRTQVAKPSPIANSTRYYFKLESMTKTTQHTLVVKVES